MYKFYNEYIRDRYENYGLTFEQAVEIDQIYKKIDNAIPGHVEGNQLSLLRDVMRDI